METSTALIVTSQELKSDIAIKFPVFSRTFLTEFSCIIINFTGDVYLA
jgi:hypothetical protein